MTLGSTEFLAFEWYARRMLDSCGSTWSVRPVEQNSNYESGIAQIDGVEWHTRTARITPTKPGAFVAIWRRSSTGETAPFTADDGRGLLVFVLDQGKRGFFRFSAEHLADLGVTASASRLGKRGFRVYPPWCVDLNRQAIRTQSLQLPAWADLPAPSVGAPSSPSPPLRALPPSR